MTQQANCTSYEVTQYHTINLSDPEQLFIWQIGHIATIISIALSFLGALFIILSFAIFRSQLKNFRNRLILYLSLNDVIFSLLHMFSHSYFLSHTTMGGPGCDGEWVCNFDGFIFHFLLAGSFFWIIVISYYLFKRVVLGQQGHIKDQYLMILVWGGNLVIAIVIYIFPKMSPRILWCSVSFGASPPYVWALLTFIGPCVLGFLLVAISYLMVVIKIRKVRNAVRASVSDDLTINRRKKENQLVRTLLYYPLVYLYQWVLTNIIVLITLIYYYELTRDQWLLIMKFDVVATCNVNLAGAFNCIIYGFNANLREEYRKYVRAKIDAQSGTPQVAPPDSNLTDKESEQRRPSRSTKFLEWIEKKL